MLVRYVQALSSAVTLEEVMAVVKEAARALTGADGATVVLREGALCHYAEEDAIGPLWKGKRFPMSECISGWVMETGQTAVIEDIYQDDRISHEAYRSTFVKSLAMVPIREGDPIGAIGSYWAQTWRPSEAQLEALRVFAAATVVAFENVRLQRALFDQPVDATIDLAAENRDLKLFSHAVAHDLRAPLRALSGYAHIVSEEWGNDSQHGTVSDYLVRIHRTVARMAERVEGLHRLAQLSEQPLRQDLVNLSVIAEEVAEELLALEPGREVSFRIEPDLRTCGDPGLLQLLLQNLFSNALKFTQDRTLARIHFGCMAREGAVKEFCVKDNGVGFEMDGSETLLTPFARLHGNAFEGLGLGMTTVRRIVERHAGRLWWEGAVDQGALFCFTLSPAQDDAEAKPRR